MDKTVISVNTIELKDELKYNGVTLLTYSISYPEFESPFYQTSLCTINRFYKLKALQFQKYCETELFNMAIEQYKDDIKNDFPVRVFEALLVFEVTYSASCIISIYFDKYEFTGGAHGNTVRTSQTWNLQKCCMIRLRQLFCCPANYKTYILKIVEEEIKKDPSIYFEDYKKLIVKTFNENNFYCTPNGIVFYYQQYDIAPYSSGIREFIIPYNECVIDPLRMCSAVQN